MRLPFLVLDKHATTIGGERVHNGVVLLTEGEAEHYLRMGAIQRKPTLFTPTTPLRVGSVSLPDEVDPYRASPDPIALAPRHPLDHDGDGRKGGSLKGSHRRKKTES